MLDTDTVIFLSRALKSNRPKAEREAAARVERRCRDAQNAGDVLGISAITVSELEFGARYGGRYDEEMSLIEGLTAPFERYEYDTLECPGFYGQIRADLKRRGVTIGPLDTLIAAHALALGATLVSNNTGHFSRVSGLKVGNWLKD
jgi:tRNA(fMet)-specific endonuclease VapC